MKTIFKLLVTLGFFVSSFLTLFAQQVKVAERGPHHRILQREVTTTNALGKEITRIMKYTELATGMHYLENGQWAETKEEIEITKTGAEAVHGQHKVQFLPNINGAGAIDLTTPEGAHMRTHILGLSFLDSSTGQSVLIAELKDSIGQLLPPNQVLYSDAFTDFDADVRYTYTMAGFEQDIILRQQLPSPSEYHLNPETTQLQVLTEFEAAPTPTAKTTVSSEGIDQKLDFGATKMGKGRAFFIGDSKTGESSVSVSKQWTTLEGRKFLVEKVNYSKIVSQLKSLPSAPSVPTNSSIQPNKNTPKTVLHRVSPKPLLPAKRMVADNTKSFQAASLSNQRKAGFVMDYQTLFGSTNDFVFQADMTYYVTNLFNLYGKTVIEGGAVIKFSGDLTAQVVLNDPNLICQTAAYRPAVFTARDDDTVGETIPGSVGTPAGYYGSGLAYGAGIGIGTPLHDLRFSYLDTGITLGAYGSENFTLTDAQFVRCNMAISMSGDSLTVMNSLFYRTRSLFTGGGSENIFRGEHLTVHECDALNTVIKTSVNLTNSLLVAVTNLDTSGLFYFNTNQVFQLSDPTGIFQTVGAAGHYLADASPYRNIGTPALSPEVSSDIKQKTTYPPIVLASQAYYYTDTTLFPQAQRDTDMPDLGYHYDPLDYAFGYSFVTNATITVLPGTAIATFNPILTPAYGMTIAEGGKFFSEGSPTNLNHLVKYNTVQEQANTNWMGPLQGILLPEFQGHSPASVINCRFTDFSVLAKDAPHVYAIGGNSEPVNLKDCQFHGGTMMSSGTTINMTNCLLERVEQSLLEYDPYVQEVRNNTFIGGTFDVFLADPSSAIKDNFFDHTIIIDEGSLSTIDHNGYVTNCDHFTFGTGDVVLTNSPDYQAGPLGRYYYPTNLPLIDAGSTNADLVGLYHFTTTTNQVKEATTTNDIGFHYAAVTGGIAVDTDGDGPPDYLEDANGNGSVDSGETSWQSATDLGLKVIITQPKANSIIP